MSTNAPSRLENNHPPRLLITAGPTHEPIDGVRYLANKSSGRLGIELATESARRNWPTTLLLGPTPLECSHTQVQTFRFSSTADLESLLAEHAPACDCLIMAAAVADFRPHQNSDIKSTKIRREQESLTLQLEPTPDLLAGIAEKRKPGQLLIGFALEPRATMLESAKAKLIRKQIDLIVANPLETMGSQSIEATLIETGLRVKDGPSIAGSTPGQIPKSEFAKWLFDQLNERFQRPAGEV